MENSKINIYLEGSSVDNRPQKCYTRELKPLLGALLIECSASTTQEQKMPDPKAPPRYKIEHKRNDIGAEYFTLYVARPQRRNILWESIGTAPTREAAEALARDHLRPQGGPWFYTEAEIRATEPPAGPTTILAGAPTFPTAGDA
jgi:hypothetical protein